MIELQALTIGAAAAESLVNIGQGKVIGVTSKGVFLRIDDRIAFLTSADYSSPFNITFADPDAQLETLQPGDDFYILAEGLSFPLRRVMVLTGKAGVTQSPPPVKVRATVDEQLSHAQEISRRLRLLAGDKGYLFLSGTQGEPLSVDQEEVLRDAKAMPIAFTNRVEREFRRHAVSLLGKGTGLTPSGDDFITGFLLYHSRFNLATGQPQDFLTEVFQQLVPLAFEKTTMISANRLLYAGRGWSEGLFLNLVDALFDAQVVVSMQDLNHLVNFGHSSGIDTFMGMLYAVKTWD